MRSPRSLSFLRMITCLTALCVAGISPDPSVAQVGKPEGLYYKSWAVVVGVENYLVAPKVPGALDSSHAVTEALRGLGFDEVIEIQDKEAASKRLLHILNDYLPRKVGRQDRIVFFFTGHAGVAQDAQSKDVGFVVPWDAQLNNPAKAITLDQLKEFSRRSASKHILLLFDANLRGWDVTAPQPLSLEGRVSPEDDTEKRSVQVLMAAEKDETVGRASGQSAFVTALVAGLKGAADRNKNGWIMASELAAQVKQDVERETKGAQHPQFVQLEGDGDVILVEGRKEMFSVGKEPSTEADRMKEARVQYEQAFSLLQQQKSAEEALERLNRAITYDPSFGDAYVLKSYLRLEVLPNLDESLAAAQAAVQHAPQNPDSHYSLGMVLEKKGRPQEAEQALQQALAVNPAYTDVYFSLGVLYADRLNEPQKSIDAFRRYLELGGQSERATRAVQGDRAPGEKPAP